MWAAMIVLQLPFFNDFLSFSAVGKYPAVQTIRSKSTVKALNKRVFPGVARFNVERLATAVTQPFLDGIGNEFGADDILRDIDGMTFQKRRNALARLDISVTVTRLSSGR